MVSNKRWGLALKKNVTATSENTKNKYGWSFDLAKTFRKYSTRDEARLAQSNWPSPTYIVDLQNLKVVR